MLRLTLARILAQEKQLAAAIAHLESAVRLDPAYTAAWKELGRLQLAEERHEAALAAWEKGIEVARLNGDKQAEKEMTVFARRLRKQADGKPEN